jgi:hypothetical protein
MAKPMRPNVAKWRGWLEKQKKDVLFTIQEVAEATGTGTDFTHSVKQMDDMSILVPGRPKRMFGHPEAIKKAKALYANQN